MTEILASVSWDDVILVGSALGIFQGTRYVHGKVTRPKSNGEFNRALCDERHKTLDKQHEATQDNFKTVFGKLDKIMEYLVK